MFLHVIYCFPLNIYLLPRVVYVRFAFPAHKLWLTWRNHRNSSHRPSWQLISASCALHAACMYFSCSVVSMISLSLWVVIYSAGTAATGYCIAQIAGGANGAPSSARVFPFRPGDRSSAAVDKNLTSILLDATTMKAIGFGKEARRRFFEMEPEEMQK